MCFSVMSIGQRNNTSYLLQVQIGVGFVLPYNSGSIFKVYIRCQVCNRCGPVDTSRSWGKTPDWAGLPHSLDSTRKLAATPEKVAAVKNCLEKYIGEHPMGPPAPPPEHHLASVTKHLWSFFTEAGARASEYGRRESP
ncbi:uncharacterized protein LOC119434956 [Dermacentor silvarum]|uniref:uncharacterized protein LOC119434956 n=1 Tax=Dermacentor silvarum TaxID=543639 RepID=UPI002100A02B|nr:uncharacterized protein LOC119434956 [Dermacentor silvarum]